MQIGNHCARDMGGQAFHAASWFQRRAIHLFLFGVSYAVRHAWTAKRPMSIGRMHGASRSAAHAITPGNNLHSARFSIVDRRFQRCRKVQIQVRNHVIPAIREFFGRVFCVSRMHRCNFRRMARTLGQRIAGKDSQLLAWALLTQLHLPTRSRRADGMAWHCMPPSSFNCCKVTIHMKNLGFSAAALLLATTLAACDGRETEDDRSPSVSDSGMSESAAPMDTATGGTLPSEASTPPVNSTADTPTPAGTADADFYRQALSSGAVEVALSAHAAGISSSAEVARIAEMLVKDHGDLNSKLRRASGMSDGVPSPAEAEAAADIKAKTGAAFDAAYLQKMSEGHRKSIALYEKASTGASDAETRGLAAAALPKLREHAGHVDKALAAQSQAP